MVLAYLGFKNKQWTCERDDVDADVTTLLLPTSPQQLQCDIYSMAHSVYFSQ